MGAPCSSWFALRANTASKPMLGNESLTEEGRKKQKARLLRGPDLSWNPSERKWHWMIDMSMGRLTSLGKSLRVFISSVTNPDEKKICILQTCEFLWNDSLLPPLCVWAVASQAFNQDCLDIIHNSKMQTKHCWQASGYLNKWGIFKQRHTLRFHLEHWSTSLIAKYVGEVAAHMACGE